MNSIVGFAQLLDDPDVDNETKSEFIKIITNSSQYLLDLINDIIDIAKIESNQIEITETLISVTDFLKTIEKIDLYDQDEEFFFESLAKGKGIMKMSEENALKEIKTLYEKMDYNDIYSNDELVERTVFLNPLTDDEEKRALGFSSFLIANFN